MNKALKERIVAFLGDLDDKVLSAPQRLEATELYNLLTRLPGRQKGWRKPAKEAVLTATEDEITIG